MKLESVTISNFRCFGLEPERVGLEAGVTAFVGSNGAGKTALFSALAKLFGTTGAQRTFRRSDFHVASGTIGPSSGTMLSIDCVFALPELDDEERDQSAIPELFSNMATTGEGDAFKVRMRLQATWIDDGTPEGTIEESLRWVNTLDEDYDWDEKCRPVQAVERNFIQLIYVPASRNALDQVTQLLKGRLWRAARWSSHLVSTASEVAERLQVEFNDESPTVFILDQLRRHWNAVHQADTDKTPLLRLVDSTLEEMVRRAEFVFTPDEAGQVRRLEELSDGQKSLFHIALTAATLQVEQQALAEDPENSVFHLEKMRRTYLTLLAIEEPENSLAPFFLSRIISLARELGSMDSAQVLMSSHSASILSRIEPTEVRHIRLRDEVRTTKVSALTLPPDESEERKFVRLAVKAYPELYFARFVVLAEGESEAIVIPRLAEAMGFALDRSFVPIVPLAGRFVKHFWRLLSDIGIPYATLLDLDLGRKHGGAKRLGEVVMDLATIGNDLSSNSWVMAGSIDPTTAASTDEAELVDDDQEHPWLQTLMEEGVYFSSPIDLDFAMLRLFPEAYQQVREGGRGPRKTEAAIAEKKLTTLKTGGKPKLFGKVYDTEFIWYPYLFLSNSKPDSHLQALVDIPLELLATDAPSELRELIKRIDDKVKLA